MAILTAGCSAKGSTRTASEPPANQVTTVDHPENNVGEFSSIAIGADDLPVISYLDFSAFRLKVAHCNDPACAGEDEKISTVPSPGGGFDTSIAIGADQLPVISYYNASAGSLEVAHCTDPACVNGKFETVDGPSGVGPATSIAIGADGLPVVSYLGGDFGDLKVAHCNDPGCSGGDETITTIIDGSPGTIGSDTSIAIGKDGLPVISFLDFDSGHLEVVGCHDPACSGEDETITAVEDFPPAQEQTNPGTSIDIGADGLPVIVYPDPAGAIKVARCNDPACTGGDETVTTVASGSDAAIAIGKGGFPVIVYSDPASAIKVARCNDAACTGGDESITIVNAEENHSYSYVSIAIGADGLPVISYHDLTAGALKVAHLMA